MKKITISLALLFLATGVTQAQKEKAMTKGEMSVNLYYGYSLTRGAYTSIANSSAQDLKVSGVGPMGAMFEYMLSDVVGLGAEFGYATTKVGWNLDGYDNNFKLTTYNYQYNFTTIRAMVRANFHFLKIRSFDMYGLVSMGYRSTSFTYTTTDPDFAGASYKSLIPFGLKPGLGMRYFFTENIGINLEVAIGTPVLGGGLSFRF